MLKIQYTPYLIIGFVAASFISFGNLLPVAVIGTALALMEFFRDRNEKETIEKLKRDNAFNGGEEDGI